LFFLCCSSSYSFHIAAPLVLPLFMCCHVSRVVVPHMLLLTCCCFSHYHSSHCFSHIAPFLLPLFSGCNFFPVVVLLGL
jgi:hypothetical protein